MVAGRGRGSQGASDGRPHGAVLAMICALLTASPVATALGLGEVGGYRMFTRLEHVRLEVVAVRGDGSETAIGHEELAPHLGRDARRVLRAAMGAGTAGDTAAASVRAAAEPLARLACELDRRRRTVRATVVTTAPGRPIEPTVLEVVHTCAR